MESSSFFFYVQLVERSAHISDALDGVWLKIREQAETRQKRQFADERNGYLKMRIFGVSQRGSFGKSVSVQILFRTQTSSALNAQTSTEYFAIDLLVR